MFASVRRFIDELAQDLWIQLDQLIRHEYPGLDSDRHNVKGTELRDENELGIREFYCECRMVAESA